jgi:hypothetical protein
MYNKYLLFFFPFLLCCSAEPDLPFEGTLKNIAAFYASNDKVDHFILSIEEMEDKHFIARADQAEKIGFPALLSEHGPIDTKQGYIKNLYLTRKDSDYYGEKIVLLARNEKFRKQNDKWVENDYIVKKVTLRDVASINKTISEEKAELEKLINITAALDDIDKYKGVKVGEPFLFNIHFSNNSEKEYQIGDYFRVLMNLEGSSWNQFTMASCGATLLAADDNNLKYGSGAEIVTGVDGTGSFFTITFGGNQITDHTQNMPLKLMEQWPRKLPPKSTITITWPVFWFADLKQVPKFVSIPSIETRHNRYYYWVDFGRGTKRIICANTKELKKIISDTSELTGLRSAAARWLLEADRNNELYLLKFIQEPKIPDSLAYRAMQALMIWGSSDIIEKIFILWKNNKLLPVLDKSASAYFTWSPQENAKEFAKQIKAGNR